MNVRTRSRVGQVIMVGLASTCFAAEASADPCASLPNPVYVTGSSAAAPLLAAVGAALYHATPAVTIVFQKGSKGSCDGVNAVVSGGTISGVGTYWPNAPADGGPPGQAQCDLPANGQAVDIGTSDVFATSCPNVTAEAVAAAGVRDYWGPMQVMTFVVPARAVSVSKISAEAAYVTLSRTERVVAPWTGPATTIGYRNENSGTQTMIGKAIHLLGSAWMGGTDKSSSGGMETFIKDANNNSTNPEQYLGILSTTEADNDRAFMKVLAFQPAGRGCAFWPDSSLTSFDKINVRKGLYTIFGPLHLLTKASGQTPIHENAAKIVSYFEGSADPPGGPTQLIDLEIANHTVPQCAMQVTRTKEMGELSSYRPSKPCGCYFDKVASGQAPAGCAACAQASECAATGKICSYGFCEAAP